jgi:hypothetical protein
MSSFFSWWDNDTRRGTFTFEVDGNDRQSIQVHFGKGSDISLKDPFIKAVEKARELGVYPCSADDIDELIYQISRKDGEDPLTIVREDAKKMLIRDVLRRVRWNNGDKLKVTLVMYEKQCSMSVYTDTRSHNLQKKLQDSKNPNAVEPDKAPMREYEIFISARFDGGPREQEARVLQDELVKIGVDARMVEAAAGVDFGTETHKYLYSMKAMIAFCFEDYGQNTTSMYSTYWELKYAFDKKKRIIPIKRCAEWPPKPPLDHDGGYKGTIQNDNVFTGGMAYLDWSNKIWSPAECAKKVKEELQK